MDRLEQILMEAYATIKANQDSSHEAIDPVLADAMRKYATEVARHNLEKQHECIRNLIRIYHNTDEDELKAIITNIVNTWMKAGD